MKRQPFIVWILSFAFVLSFSTLNGLAQTSTDATVTTTSELKLDAPTLDAVVDQLFGTPDGGLLDGTKSFQLHAKNMELTAEQSASFFGSATEENLAALVEATEGLHGVVHLSGEIAGEDFELKISGAQLKLDGISLTAAQRDALIASLREVDGLKQIKINALVDGEKTTIRLQGNLLKSDLLARENGRENGRRGLDRAAEVRAERLEVERPAKVEAHQRIENLGRLEILDRPGRGAGSR